MYNISFLSFYYIVHSIILLLLLFAESYIILPIIEIIAISRFAKPPWKNTTKKLYGLLSYLSAFIHIV